MTIANILKNRRQELQLSQKQVAEATGMTTRQLSNYESGIRNPDSEILGRLRKTLRLETLDYSQVSLPALSKHICGPRSYRFRIERTVEQRIWTAMQRRKSELGHLAQYFNTALMKELNHFPTDSCWEAVVLLLLAILGAARVTARPLEERYFRHTILHPLDGLPAGHLRLPALILEFKGRLLLFFPQVVLNVSGFKLDLLVGVRRRDRPSWSNIEIDGEGHDASGDRYRTDAVGLPTLRYKPDDICQPGFAERMVAEILALADGIPEADSAA